VVRQDPVEMLQQCWSASSCMQMCIVMEEHDTGCQYPTPFFWITQCSSFSVSQYKTWLSSQLAHFFDRHTKTYSPIQQVPQFWWWLRWEVA
jgi:hypothetical protein